MSRSAVVALLAMILSTTGFEVALADPGQNVHSHAGASAFVVDGAHVQLGGSTEPVASNAEIVGHWESQTVCDTGGLALCNDALPCPDGSPVVHWWFVDSDGRTGSDYFQCPQEPSPAAQPQITNALVLRALRRVDLPASELGVQPPGGETLVNFETNFFTDSGAFTRSVRLLGRRVDLRVWPSRFHWVFGDGAELVGSSAGARYPDLEITHAYEVEGSVRPSVDTTYAARYRVDGGPWRDVVGTVTIAGGAVRLVVRTARPVLVSDR